MADVVVVPHTHWDREWYQTFQVLRVRLIAAVRRVLELLESGALPYFLLDGQTVMIDDYLEIRPQDEARVRALARAGRLGVGPWYVLPDELLVSGEALVRNLLFGRAGTRRLQAADSRVGYLPDMFGHTAQMPQILRGFGLDRAVVWRGVAPPPGGRFFWADLSGGGVAALHLPTGYGNVHLWAPLSAAERAERQRAFLTAQGGAGPHLLLSGCDHLAPNPDLPAIVSEIGARLGRIEDALPPPGPGALPVIRGELRQTGRPRQHLLPDVASARMWIKQDNAAVQDLWERSVEPLLALQVAAGLDIEPGLWREGWGLILRNHPHDSICGCSIDEVHQEMAGRCAQARALGLELVARALDAFAPVEDAPGVLLYNPSGWARGGWVEVAAEAPREWAARGAGVHIEGAPSVLLGAEDGVDVCADIDADLDWRPVRRFRLLVCITGSAALPPFGLRHLRLAPAWTAPVVSTDLQVSADAIENSHLRLRVADGALELRVKDGGAVIADLLRFEDDGDAGDTYSRSPPEDDRRVTAALRGWRLVESSPAHAVLELEHGLDLPAALTPDRRRRAAETIHTVIRTRLTLEADSRVLRCEGHLENQARDHRLRALVATGAPRPREIVSEVAFGFVPREPGRPGGALPVPPHHESAPATFPHLGVVAVEGERHAVQLLAPGLPEAEILDGGRAVALTLLRCVGWLSRGDLRTRGGAAGPPLETPQAQCLGRHAFRFSLRVGPPGRDGRSAWWGALPELDHARHPVRARPTGGHRRYLAGGAAPPAAWLAAPPPAVVLSACKPTMDGRGVLVRAYNPTPEPQVFSLCSGGAWTCAPCDLAEEPLGPEAPAGAVHLAPGVIASRRLRGG